MYTYAEPISFFLLPKIEKKMARNWMFTFPSINKIERYSNNMLISISLIIIVCCSALIYKLISHHNLELVVENDENDEKYYCFNKCNALKCTKNRDNATLSRCQSCSMVLYCSKEHQVQDWSSHKHACKAIRERFKKEIGFAYMENTSSLLMLCTSTYGDGSIKLLKESLKSGANINFLLRNDHTILESVVSCEKIKLSYVNALIDYGININTLNKKGQNALLVLHR